MDYTLIPQPTEYHYSNTTHPLSYPFSTDPGAGAGAAVQSSPVPRISNELKVLLAWTKLTRPHNPAGLKPGTVIARNQGRHSLKVYKTTHDRTRSFILINRADWKCAMQQLTPCFVLLFLLLLCCTATPATLFSPSVWNKKILFTNMCELITMNFNIFILDSYNINSFLLSLFLWWINIFIKYFVISNNAWIHLALFLWVSIDTETNIWFWRR